MRRIRICPPCSRHMPTTWQTWNHPLRFICLTDARRLGKYPRYFPASSATCSTAIGHHQHCILPCHASVLHYLPLFIVSSPSSSPIAPETDAAQETDDTTDDPSFAAELPRKRPPFDACLHHLFLLPPACIRNCYCCCFILFCCIACPCNCF